MFTSKCENKDESQQIFLNKINVQKKHHTLYSATGVATTQQHFCFMLRIFTKQAWNIFRESITHQLLIWIVGK